LICKGPPEGGLFVFEKISGASSAPGVASTCSWNFERWDALG
jgi:hypothetical protein